MFGFVLYIIAATVPEKTSSDLVTIMVALIAAMVSLGTAYITMKLRQVHVLVNSKMDTALKRINELELKLGLEPDELIPTAPILTESTTEDITGKVPRKFLEP